MLIDNKNKTITDTSTNLMWKQEQEEGVYDWKEAVELSCDFAGHDDWRLPTIKELLSIVNYEKFNPALSDLFTLSALHSVIADSFWSSSPYAHSSSNAWVVYFNYGNNDFDYKDYSYGVRLVRNV